MATGYWLPHPNSGNLSNDTLFQANSVLDHATYAHLFSFYTLEESSIHSGREFVSLWKLSGCPSEITGYLAATNYS